MAAAALAPGLPREPIQWLGHGDMATFASSEVPVRQTCWAVIGIAVLGLCGIAAHAGEPPGARGGRLGEPGYLSETARQALHTKMSAHAFDMRSLLEGVLLLRRPEIRAAAQRILDEPRIARPTAGSDANAMLPERYFLLQDRLRDRARALAKLTQRGTDQQIAAAFAGVTQICVECHSTYLRGAKERRDRAQ